jgi:hypothetical protein
MTRPWSVAVALAACAALLPHTVGAQAPSDDGPPPYRPSLADLMTTTVQPRHVKLAFAGRRKNWDFAAYELKQMSDAFDRLSVQWPQWRRQPMVELVETIVRDPLFELNNAIKRQNQAQFIVAYAHLTEACNACHQAALQTPVVIQDRRTDVSGPGLSAKAVSGREAVREPATAFTQTGYGARQVLALGICW